MKTNKIKIGVVGLGYVGLPLACLFSKKYSVVGFDVNKKRINEINSDNDSTDEVAPEVLKRALHHGLVCTSVISRI